MTRREWLQTTGAAAALAVTPNAFAADPPGFTLPKLPYAFDALEPYIDAKTMEIHHDRHHKAYVDNLNKALEGTDWLKKPIEDVLRHVNELPELKRQAVINNGGGHYNHSIFWQIMGKGGGKPSSELLASGGWSFDDLKNMLKGVAMNQFGSGWAWVAYYPKDKKLVLVGTPNQDTPLRHGDMIPVLGIDVWEHAYYLKYQNKRADYIDAWWNVVNWDAVNERFKMAIKG